ncbi:MULTISPECIES: ABC transporter ATP-binding protein [Bacillaceae]|uniref:ABC transporter ATP-binding protein n=1 Tax=Bacillaceae TaxID=186817 RepID=UPI001C57C2D3|nr:ABC transporter ATP-binding protein [Rossellomorea sp. YZS02]MBW3114650.1 ABC transporter ATP-binding protein [Bacillus sp. MCCB 382]MDX8345695.1 ABC transporter ATP-binding protein [Rossellomorea sp. YZS02]
MIEIVNVSKQYEAIQALQNIGLTIPEGTCFGLVGPNGAGKSTLMKILSGVLQNFEGDIIVKGHSVMKDRIKVKKLIGYIPQDICLEETLTAKDNLRYFGSLYGLKGKELQDRCENVLKQIGLYERKKDKVSTFSGGMKRRLNIGCALLHNPSIIIMDEPTVGIDPQSRNSIFSIIHELKEKGSTIIYSSHYMEEVEHLCDSIALIDKGTLVESGSMDELLQKYNRPSLFISGEGLNESSLSVHGELESKGNGFLLHSVDPLVALENLIVDFRSQNILPRRLELYQPKLEDIFFDLTGTQLRDS